jgi:pyrimidine operon attenuation protein/uracil phosphoribosyltransferase
MNDPSRTALLDAPEIARIAERMAREIREFAGGTDDLVLVGIQRRGVDLAERLATRIGADAGAEIPRGAVDITLYRDDLQTVGPRPIVGETFIPFDLTGKWVVIVDDVLYTGRTVRAALAELADFGRPARIGLAVLVDRGGRELPIQADIVGHRVDVTPGDRIDVLLEERDGRDAVERVQGSGA